MAHVNTLKNNVNEMIGNLLHQNIYQFAHVRLLENTPKFTHSTHTSPSGSRHTADFNARRACLGIAYAAKPVSVLLIGSLFNVQTTSTFRLYLCYIWYHRQVFKITRGFAECYCQVVEHVHAVMLTHWGRNKMAAIFQTKLSNAFSLMRMLEFRLRFHWSLFLRF